jgi:nicotinate phosphoribosyltransferase
MSDQSPVEAIEAIQAELAKPDSTEKRQLLKALKSQEAILPKLYFWLAAMALKAELAGQAAERDRLIQAAKYLHELLEKVVGPYDGENIPEAIEEVAIVEVDTGDGKNVIPVPGRRVSGIIPRSPEEILTYLEKEVGFRKTRDCLVFGFMRVLVFTTGDETEAATKDTWEVSVGQAGLKIKAGFATIEDMHPNGILIYHNDEWRISKDRAGQYRLGIAGNGHGISEIFFDKDHRLLYVVVPEATMNALRARDYEGLLQRIRETDEQGNPECVRFISEEEVCNWPNPQQFSGVFNFEKTILAPVSAAELKAILEAAGLDDGSVDIVEEEPYSTSDRMPLVFLDDSGQSWIEIIMGHDWSMFNRVVLNPNSTFNVVEALGKLKSCLVDEQTRLRRQGSAYAHGEAIERLERHLTELTGGAGNENSSVAAFFILPLGLVPVVAVGIIIMLLLLLAQDKRRFLFCDFGKAVSADGVGKDSLQAEALFSVGIGLEMLLVLAGSASWMVALTAMALSVLGFALLGSIQPVVKTTESLPALDQEVRREHTAIARRIGRSLADVDSDMRNALSAGAAFYLGSESEAAVQELYAMASSWRSEYEHVIFFTNFDTTLARLFLQALTHRLDWNEYLRAQGLAQIHFVSPLDTQGIARVSQKLSGRHIVLQQASGPGVMNNFPDSEYVCGQENKIVLREHILALIAAGIVDPQAMLDILLGAKEALADWQGLSSASDIRKHPAYQFALTQLRLAIAGQDVSLFLVFSTRLAALSKWMAGLFNQALGESSLDVWFSGESATEYFHSTQQGWAQAKGFEHTEEVRQRERRGFISLAFFNPQLSSEDEVVTGQANHHYRGFGMRFMLKMARESLRLAMRLANRAITEVDFAADTPKDLGRVVFFGELSAVMAQGIARKLYPLEQTPRSLDGLISSQKPELSTRLGIPDGTFRRDQNILTFRENDGELTVGGLLGEKILEEITCGSPQALKQVVKVMGRLVSSGGLAKVVKDYQAGDKLVHLDPGEVRRDLRLTEAMAGRFAGYKRLYVLAIGGSITGEALIDALNLEDGPQVIGVHSYDTELLRQVQADIRNDPQGTAILVISKSGVTSETDANSWTLIQTLMDCLPVSESVGEHILFITDPQLGTLRQTVEKEGYLSLEHHVYIGGRFSMWSNVGTFLYFVKGGKREALEEALAQWDAWHEQLRKVTQKGKGIKADSLDLEAIFKDASKLLEKKQYSGIDYHLLLRAMYSVYLLIKDIPGVLEGLLDNLLNTAYLENSYNTEVVVALSSGLQAYVNGPLYAQQRAESISKPGVRFYGSSVWSEGGLRTAWNNLMTDRRAYLFLLGEHHQEVTPATAEEQEIWRALKDACNERGIPYLALRMGEMSVANLLHFNWLQFLRVAVDASLYEPMEVNSEGQPGVELTKNVFRAVLAKVHSILAARSAEEREALMRTGVVIPYVPAHEIERMTDLDIDISHSLCPDDEALAKLVMGILSGIGTTAGLASQASRDALEFRPKSEIQPYLQEAITTLLGASGNIKRYYLDGRITYVDDSSRWIVRATSIESIFNLITGTANGTSVGIYEEIEGRLTLRFTIRIIWGSSLRVVLSNGRVSQDYVMLYDGRLIEVDKSKEDNSMTLSVIGTYLAPGGRSSLRPQNFQAFEAEILVPTVNTKIRISDTPTADMYKIMIEQGLFGAWVSWGEALGIAQVMEAASGFAMVMTPRGMQHVRDTLPEDVAIEGDPLASTQQVYIYAGNPDSVRQIQVFADLLNIYDNGEAAVLKLLKLLKEFPEDTTAAVKAQAIMWVLRLREGLRALPSASGLKGRVSSTVKAVEAELEQALASLDQEEITQALREEYLSLSLEERSLRAQDFILLGDLDAQLRVKVAAGEATRLVYSLEKAFNRSTAWSLMQAVEEGLRKSGNSDQAAVIEELMELLNQHYSLDAPARPAPYEPPFGRMSFAETFEEYLTQSVNVCPSSGVRGIDTKLPQAGRAVLLKIIDVYLHDQPVENVSSDARLSDLRAREPELFYEQEGTTYVRSLRWIQKNLRERKTGVMVNQSGDVSSRLDDIFNQLLIHFTLPLVSVIISEEEAKPVMGVIVEEGDIRYILMLDPIDGSSQISSGGTYGMIVTLGVLLPGQKIEDFDARHQVLAGFDLMFGPRTRICSLNPCNNSGKPEAACFELTQDPDSSLFFRKEVGYPELSLKTLEDKLIWSGLIPSPNVPSKALRVAMGGSFIDSPAVHAKVVSWLMYTYGHELDYTGALVNDMGKLTFGGILRPEVTIGILHTYGPTNKYLQGRFRRAFEEYFYALLLAGLGGEVIDGHKPMLTNRLTGETPSKLTSPYYATSRWASKLIMAWYAYVKEHASTASPDSEETDKLWDEFIHYYEASSRALITAAENALGVPEAVVRRALLDKDGDISSFLLEENRDEAVKAVREGLQAQGLFSVGGPAVLLALSPAGIAIFLALLLLPLLLAATEAAKEQNPVIVGKVAVVLAMGDIYEIFDPETILSLKGLGLQLEKLRYGASEEDFARAQATAMKLSEAYLTTKRQEIGELLTGLLSELVALARLAYDIYGKMGGDLYRAITWNNFQGLYGLLKNLYSQIRPGLEDEADWAMFAGTEELMQELGDSHRIIGNTAQGDFASRFLAAVDDASMIELLKQEYGLPDVQIQAERRAPLFFLPGAERVYEEDGSHYTIGLIKADGIYAKYFILHGFLHIWLLKNGFNFEWETEDEQVRVYWWWLRDLIADYLIEKEVQRVFGSEFAGVVQDVRDTHLEAGIRAYDLTGFEYLMFALVCKAATGCYSELRGCISQRLVGTGIKFKGINDMLDVLAGISLQGDLVEYESAVSRIHRMLTGSSCVLHEGQVSANEAHIKVFVDETEEMMAQVRDFLRSHAAGRPVKPGSRQRRPDAYDSQDTGVWALSLPALAFAGTAGIVAALLWLVINYIMLQVSGSGVTSRGPPAAGLVSTIQDLLSAQESYLCGNHQEILTYDYSIPRAPYDGDYILTCGQRSVAEYLRDLRVSPEDITLLRGTGLFQEDFLKYLSQMKFSGRIFALPEGTVVGANEPILRVEAPRPQLEIIKSVVRNTLSYQCLLATKASRIVRAARGKTIAEYGLRRAQGEASLLASRASFLAGCIATSNVYAGKMFGIPISGTMAHSFIMGYPTELEAFRAYARVYKNRRPVLLIDTYGNIPGAKNALIVAEELRQAGCELFAVRIDSGDLVEDALAVRALFDAAGYDGTKYHKILIFGSSDLDEYEIQRLLAAGAPFDGFGVGTNMVTGGEQSMLEADFSPATHPDAAGFDEIFLKKLRPQTAAELFADRERALEQLSLKFPDFILPPKPASPSLAAEVIGPSGTEALVTDLYQLTMLQAYFKAGRHNDIATFDYFYRTPPKGEQYLICAGLGKVLDYLENLRFSENDLAYLKALGIFDDDFLAWLREFRFVGEVMGVPEGTAVFPREPILRVTAPLAQAQYVETYILNAMNFQSLEATRVNRFSLASQDVPFVENGLIWAQGLAHADVSRGAFIGGASATTNIAAARRFGIPLKAMSCDLSVSAEEVAHMRIRGGLKDYFGIGSRIATGGQAPALSGSGKFSVSEASDYTASLGGVYKLSEINGRPVLKVSGTREKTTLPGRKTMYRVLNKEGKLRWASIALEGQDVSGLIEEGDAIFNPTRLVFNGAARLYPEEGLGVIQQRCKEQRRMLALSVAFADSDTQSDFMDEGGKLAIIRAGEIRPNLSCLTICAGDRGLVIFCTMDTHVEDDPEFAQFPPHCLAGTPGWEKIPETTAAGEVIIEKNTFSVFSNPKAAEVFGAYDVFVVYGVATDYCVRALCLGLIELGKRVYLVTDAIKEVTEETGRAALEEMQAAGVISVTTEQIVKNRIYERVPVAIPPGLQRLQDELVQQIQSANSAAAFFILPLGLVPVIAVGIILAALLIHYLRQQQLNSAIMRLAPPVALPTTYYLLPRFLL